jgi:hypothetical protein
VDERWIFESPDGGKTVTKRKPQTDEKWVYVGEQPASEWEPFSTVIKIVKQRAIEEQLRQENPTLKEAWDQYQLLLSLYQSENPVDK